METPRTATIGLLLSVILIAWPVLGGPADRPKSPSAGGSASVLLQEGLYAEEIEGDLDGAIKIYEQVLAEAKDIEQAAAQATYRIGICFLKKGDKTEAAKYFNKLISEHPKQGTLVAKAQDQLAKLGIGQPDSADQISLYEKLPPEVIEFVGNKYGSICTEAGAKKLYSNSHVYYVTSDFVLLKGGMGYYHNLSDKALFNKIRLCGTSEPKQTHYDIAGREMNTEIVPDKVRQGFYHIYWTPYQPVPAGEMFYYGWCIDKAKQLPPASPQDPASSSAQYKLTMQNQFGNRVIETFFLVVPTGTEIVSKSEDYTAKDTIAGFDIYCFSKEVPEDASHQVDVVLAGPGPAETKTNLYERLPNEVLMHIGGKYGGISAEAAAKSLYSNSHIYYVTSDWVLLKGGMGYYRNGSNQARSEKIRLSGTSSPNQTLYDVAGRQMNIEIVQDKMRQGFYHIYWTPSEPIPPGQMFYYGWSNDQSRTLQAAAGPGQYKLTMQNHFGERVIETFFLVVPLNTSIISRTEEFTGKDTVGGFDIYYWSKEVPQNTNNVVNISLAARSFSAPQPQEVTLPIVMHARADIDLRVKPGDMLAYDFDKAAFVTIPPEFTRRSEEPGSEGVRKGAKPGIEWVLDSGADVVAVVAPNEGGLLGAMTVFEKLPSQTWDSIRPDDLKLVADKQWRKNREQTVTSRPAQDSHPIYAFKTAQGGLGVVQLIEVDRAKQVVKFRYASLPDAAEALKPLGVREHRAILAEKLKVCGKTMHLWAGDHGGKFPDTLVEMKEYIEAEKEGDPEWMLENVMYVAAGKASAYREPHRAIAAYDRTLLERDTGTNVLFLDSHVEFIPAEQLEERGIDLGLIESDVAGPATAAEPDISSAPTEQPGTEK